MLHNRKARRRAAALARRERARAQISAPGFLRAAALGTVAAGAMMLSYGRTAQAGPDACITVGNVATCQGNQSAGIASGTDFLVPPVTTLNVNNLNQNIAPAAGVDGISFSSFGGADPIVINSDTTGGPGGPFEIIATGLGGDGINAQSNTSVTVNSTGNVTGGGYGIAAQSSGVVNVTSTGDVTGVAFQGISVVSFTANATVTSIGNVTGGARGIFVQSAGGAVVITSTGDVTGGAFSGIEAEAFNSNATVTSIGNVSGAIHGIFANANNGNVTVNSTGTINAGQRGIYGYVQSGAVSVTSNGNITSTQDGIFARVGVGDGNVTVNSTGNITTTANDVDAIYARIAGNGALSVTSTGNLFAEEDGIDAQVIGNGSVTVNSTGNITTTDDRGIDAFVGGDGNVTVTSVGNIDADLLGILASAAGTGDVTITSTGNVSGFQSFALSGQANTGNVTITSVGNATSAGGNAIQASTDNGVITISNTGNATSNGNNYSGVYTYALAGSVTVNLANSTVQGGTGTGAGVNFASLAGVTSTLNINGPTTLSSPGGTAIRGAAGDEIINNNSTLTAFDDIVLGGGTNAFNNNGGGIFNSGDIVNLGGGNLFTNAGTFSPGAVGALQTTVLTGNINQTASGIFQVDVGSTAGTSDLVNVTGTATLNGNVLAQVVNPALGPQSNLILSATGGTTNNALGLLASPALQASLTFPNATDVVLNTDIDFLAPGSGLNRNQTNLANNLNAILGSGGGTVGPVLTALLNGVTDLPSYLDALDQLLPEAYLNTEATALFAAEEFNSNLLSCPQAGQGYTAVSQGECMWVRYDGRWLDRDSTRQNVGYEEDTHGISGGGQVAVAPNWFVGIAAAYEDSDLDAKANASADTDRYMLGGVIKYQSGPALVALAGSFGSGEVDMARGIAIGGFNATARSSFDVDHVGATFHAAYLADRGTWYAKPFVDVNVIHIDRDSAREAGAGAANLNISGSDETYFSVTPALELGTTIDRGDGRAIRPYVRAGVAFYGDTDQSLTASFAGAPAGVGGFTTTSEFDDVFADIAAGVTLFHGQTGTVSAGYEGRFSDDTDVHGFFVKGTRAF